jgi:hypothetical protein
MIPLPPAESGGQGWATKETRIQRSRAGVPMPPILNRKKSFPVHRASGNRANGSAGPRPHNRVRPHRCVRPYYVPTIVTG